jgi:hypothetical protein
MNARITFSFFTSSHLKEKKVVKNGKKINFLKSTSFNSAQKSCEDPHLRGLNKIFFFFTIIAKALLPIVCKRHCKL